MTRIRALPERAACEIRFPNVAGYRVAYPPGPLRAHFTEDSKLTVTPDDIPTTTDVEPIVGEGIKLTLENYASQRMKSVYFAVAGYTLRRYIREDVKPKSLPHRRGHLSSLHAGDSAPSLWRDTGNHTPLVRRMPYLLRPKR